jgi:hypothetical protein
MKALFVAGHESESGPSADIPVHASDVCFRHLPITLLPYPWRAS